MLTWMRLSTIAKHEVAGSGTRFSRVLGAEIRRRRLALGLSQGSIGRPLSRAFLSSIESGRTVPSLPSLLMIARRLHSTGAMILASVEIQLEEGGDDADADQAAIPR
jgi:transcriptional regulator with XRE-family HTH domain